MVEEDYVSYDLAVLLKEKGFNGPCASLYNVYGVNEIEHGYADSEALCNSESDVSRFIEDSYDDDSFVFVTAPSYGHVMKWFRVVHKMCIVIHPMGNGEYDWYIYKIDGSGEWMSSRMYGGLFPTFEDACLDAIKLLLEKHI